MWEMSRVKRYYVGPGARCWHRCWAAIKSQEIRCTLRVRRARTWHPVGIKRAAGETKRKTKTKTKRSARVLGWRPGTSSCMAKTPCCRAKSGLPSCSAGTLARTSAGTCLGLWPSATMKCAAFVVYVFGRGGRLGREQSARARPHRKELLSYAIARKIVFREAGHLGAIIIMLHLLSVDNNNSNKNNKNNNNN